MEKRTWSVENPFKIGFLGALGALVALLLAGILGSISTVLTYIGAALFLALGFDPLISFLERKKWPRPVAMLVLFVGVLVIIVLVVWAIVPSITEQVNELSIRYGAIIGDLLNSNIVEWLSANFPALDVQAAIAQATSWLQQNAASITGGVLQVGVGIINGLFGVLIVFILMIYFVTSMNTIKQGFYQLTPASNRASTMEITEEITGSVGKYVVGQISLGLINGVLSFIFLSLIGATMPMVFAVIAFLGSLIPMVGTISASTIIVLSQLILNDPNSPIWWIAAIYYLVYMQIEAYLISPRIMSSAVKVPGSIVVIAALTGGTLLGLLGALIAIPVAASLIIIVRKVIIPHQNAR
ncbi:AI-2E family transporter [Gulosibacter molinativorax]|uniref:AI-2E family transporter n=1 Tax=Gulosibacter molinativorax TaxID=256821 RepID=A0ABT7CBX3_9MICO|nr:AI-2E family transporter [Gulosibacter molinativorax]MDJ1372649.1 AI-2E family transporter [Gulosibacter molinativorax]QUY60763.1 AI-2 transport protein TqsA [Gulosibacter molinativorax]